MILPRLLKWGCLTAGVVCLAAGYARIGQWGILALAGLVWLAGVLAAGWSGEVFVVSVILAAVGVCVGAWPTLMISGAMLALASWDLAHWEQFVADGLPAADAARIEWRHYAFLALALGAGLLVALIGRLVSFHLPFGILLALTALALLGIDQIWRLVKR
jgi:hypothetical protein